MRVYIQMDQRTLCYFTGCIQSCMRTECLNKLLTDWNYLVEITSKVQYFQASCTHTLFHYFYIFICISAISHKVLSFCLALWLSKPNLVFFRKCPISILGVQCATSIIVVIQINKWKFTVLIHFKHFVASLFY